MYNPLAQHTKYVRKRASLTSMLPSKNQEPKLTREGANKCFGCGQDNPIGLRLSFRQENGRTTGCFVPDEVHQGWPGLVHGGILFTILDEAMGYTFYAEGTNGVTARAETRFRRPAPIGEPLLIEATVTKRTKKLIEAKATMTFSDGRTVAEGKALMYIVNNHSVE